MKKARQNPSGPIQNSARGPARKSRIGTPFLPLSHWQWPPLVIPLLQPRFSPETKPEHRSTPRDWLPWFWALKPSPFVSIKGPGPPQISPSCFPAQAAARPTQSLDGEPQYCRCVSTNPVQRGDPATHLWYPSLRIARSHLPRPSRHFYLQ
jgi:hypothetical protein